MLIIFPAAYQSYSFFNFISFCMYKHFIYMCVPAPCEDSQRSEEGIRHFGTGVTDSCELSCDFHFPWLRGPPT